MTRLRLVHSRHPLLALEHLAQFATPKTWAEIVNLSPRLRAPTWIAAIIDADEYGFGLLTWIKAEPKTRQGVRSELPRAPRKRGGGGAWVLSDRGREYVARGKERRAS